MKTVILAFLALAASAETTATCGGCTAYGTIPGTAYTADYGKRMVWTVGPLDPGTYQVDLTFVEWPYTKVNQRPITVTVNDAPMLKAFDIWAAGGYLKPVTRSTLVPVVDGKIVIVITNDLAGHSAILSGLTVTLQ